MDFYRNNRAISIKYSGTLELLRDGKYALSYLHKISTIQDA